MVKKMYLGDGAFAEYDDISENLVITTEDGQRVTNRVVFDANTLGHLLRFIDQQCPYGPELVQTVMRNLDD